jgi:hypothetical protein
MNTDTICCLIGWDLGSSISKEIQNKTKSNDEYSSNYLIDHERQLKENEIIYNNYLQNKKQEPPKNSMN